MHAEDPTRGKIWAVMMRWPAFAGTVDSHKENTYQMDTD